MYFYLKKMLPSSPNIDFHMFPAQSYNAKGCPFTIEWGREAKIFDPFPSNIDFFPKKLSTPPPPTWISTIKGRFII